MRISLFRQALATFLAAACLFTTITCVPAVGRLGRYFDPGYYVYEPDVIVVEEYVYDDEYYYYDDEYYYDDGGWFDFWWDDCC